MTIEIFNVFSKAKNSTRIPAIDGEEVSVVLKNLTSKTHPVFDIATRDTIPTYCKWGSYYYFVDDVEHVTNTIMRLHCSIDSLGTLRGRILSSSQYVLRSQSFYDYAITDSENTPTNTISHQTTITAMPVNFDSTRTGCCIIGIGASSVGASGVPDRGTAVYYALTGTQLMELSQALSSGTVLEDLAKEFNGGMNGIITAMYINVPVTAIPSSGSGNIIIGQWNSGVSARIVNSRQLSGSTNILFNNYYGESDCYLNKPPYTNVYVYLPYVGVIPVDTDIHGSAFKLTAFVDIFTGTITYKISSTNENALDMPMSVYRGRCGVDIPLQYGSRNVLGMLSGAVTTFSSVAQKNIAGVIGGTLQMASAATLNTQVLGDVGDMGNVMLGDQFVYTHTLTKRPAHGVADLISRVGAPIERLLALNTISGYCQCRNAKLDVSALRSIVDSAETMMNTGFYIE